MRRLVALGIFVVLAVLPSGCGGGGASSSSPSPGAAEAPTSRTSNSEEGHRHGHQDSKKKEQRERHEHEVFLEEEEDRIVKEEEREEAREAREEEEQRKAHRAQQDAKSKASPAASAITAEEFHQFKGTDLGNWEIAYGTCAVTPEKQLAREYHTEQNWAAIGHAYGQDYREPFNIAAEEGCMAALVDSEEQREAAFALMEGK